MYILAIETTGRHASAALIDDRGNIHEEASDRTLNHLQDIIPMTARLFEKSGVARKDLTHVAASAGPGSFTGIRIGVSTARALAQALEIPAIKVPTLKAFAYNGQGAQVGEGLICPILDARRNQVYGGGFFFDGDGEISEAVAQGAYRLDEFLELVRQEASRGVKRPIIFFGDGIEAYRHEIERWQQSSPNADMQLSFAHEEIRLQRASSVAKLALSQFQRGETLGFENLKPMYMRKAEAERKLLKVRKAEEADVKAIAGMDKVCFTKPWSERSFYEEIARNEAAVYFVASIDDKIVGYAGFWGIAGEGHITNVAVSPDFRRKGVATALVREVLESAFGMGITAYTLEVRVSNDAAISLYRKFGFRECGVRKNYYEDNDEDALIMWKIRGQEMPSRV